MRVLITGHDGYLGAVMVPLLQEASLEVEGLDTGLFTGSQFGDQSVTAIPSLKKDIRDVEKKDLEGYDAVIHLAALSNDPLGNLNAKLTHEINFEGTLRVATLAKEAGVKRYLFSSSCSTYGSAGDDFLDESADFNPVTPYAVEKVRMEDALSALADPEFSPTYLRNATAYGLSPRLRLDLVLNNLVAWAHTTGEVLLLSDGTPWRPIVHAEDIARAFLAVLKAPREVIHNEPFNVGRTEHNYRIRELADIVAEVVPGSEVKIAEGAGPDKRCYRVSCKKLETTLPDYQPQWDARRSAKRLWQAYREAKLTLEDLQGARFNRLKHLQGHIDAGRLDGSLRWLNGHAS